MLNKLSSKISKTKVQNSRYPLKKAVLYLGLILIFGLLVSGCTTAPGVSLTIDPQSSQPQQVTSGVKLLVLMTILSLAPAVLILATSFTRIVIVLSMLRSAIGTPSVPPNQVIIGLSLLL